MGVLNYVTCVITCIMLLSVIAGAFSALMVEISATFNWSKTERFFDELVYYLGWVIVICLLMTIIIGLTTGAFPSL